MTRILVTGASGFLGRHALPHLTAQGFEVHALGRSDPKAPDVNFHKVDLLDKTTLLPVLEYLRASHLLHLAWYAEPRQYWQSALNLDWTAASMTLVRHFHDLGGHRVVVAGSCAEYSWGPTRLSEHAPCCPTTLYGAAKDATRRVLEAYASASQLSFAWGRLFFLYGPGERSGRLVSDAFQTLLAGRRFATSAGRQKRDFSHVSDAAGALAALVSDPTTGPVNIGSGDAIPVRSIVEEIGLLTNRSELIDFDALPNSTTEPLSIEADIKIIRDQVGYLNRHDLKSGLRDTYKHYTK